MLAVISRIPVSNVIIHVCRKEEETNVSSVLYHLVYQAVKNFFFACSFAVLSSYWVLLWNKYLSLHLLKK